MQKQNRLFTLLSTMFAIGGLSFNFSVPKQLRQPFPHSSARQAARYQRQGRRMATVKGFQLIQRS